jgi:MoaA/NifB/PqqE/SkfB family radical SAM enzyme
VSIALVSALSFVTERVFPDDRSIYSSDVLENEAAEINIDVFRDIGELLEKSGADSVNFRLTSAAGAQTVSSGHLSPQRFQRLQTYVDFARQRLAADRNINVIGRIVELRSRRPDRTRNYVGMAAILDDREVFISITMRKQDYPSAVMAHNRNKKVRLRAAVRQMRTQLRVIKLESFEELDESADSTEV